MESPASGSEDPDPPKVTFNGAGPLLGTAVRAAVGGVFGAQKSLPETVYDPPAVESARTRRTPTRFRVSPWMPEMSEPADGGAAGPGPSGSSLLLERVIVIVPSGVNVPASACPRTFSVLKPVLGSMAKKP